MALRCLDDEAIAAFAAGAGSARAAIEEHLDVCEDCRELLAIVIAGGGADGAAAELQTLTDEATIEAPLVVHDFETAADSSRTVPASSALGDRFALEQVVGRGGMGTVFRARELASGGLVALKLMRGDASDPKRVSREIEVLSKLEHPAIVRYVAHGETADAGLYLAMEWLDGLTLEERLCAGRLTIEETIALGLRVADGLELAHARGVVHRDIKPSNLMLVQGRIEEVKIVDFGIARHEAGEPRLTLTGALLGTPGYMAPEQARGEADVGPAADLFALGAVLYHALAGAPPFAGADVLAILMRTVLEAPARPGELRPDVPEELDALVMAMLAKSAFDRPASADEVRARLMRAARQNDEVRAPQSRALTDEEQRLFSVVLVRSNELALPLPTSLHEIATRHGGRTETLLDGSLLVALTNAGAPTDQAMRAARCALAIKALAPAAGIALATGRGRVGEVGTPAFDRLSSMPVDALAVRIDDVTAGLLDARFELGATPSGFALLAERTAVDDHRTLLGRPSPCVGRERELGRLQSIFEECVAEGVPRKVLVAGEAGIGKSRLRRELLQRLERKRPHLEIWTGRGDAMSAGSPFSLLVPPLLRSAGITPRDEPELRRRRLLARVGRNVDAHRGLTADDSARIAMFLAEAAGIPFPSDASPILRAARRDPRVMADQIGRAWLELFAAESSAQPLVVVLEDVHWGDRASVQVLSATLSTLHASPIFVLAFARPEVRDLFPELTIPQGAEELSLRPLARRASEDLVRCVLGEATDVATMDRILGLSQGNPFFLEELIRATAEGRGDAPPETVLAMLEARLAELDVEERRLLRAASVFGGVFWTDAIASLLGRRASATELGLELEDLARREIITLQRGSSVPGEHEYRFRHALVREAAYAMLTDEDRREGHARAGKWLRDRGVGEPLALGEHFDRGGEPGLAADAYLKAAEQALDANDSRAASALGERAALAALASEERDDARLGRMYRVRAEAHRWRAEYQECERWAESALPLLGPGSFEWFAAVGLIANASARLGHVQIFAAASKAIRATEAEAEAGEERSKAVHMLLAEHWFNGSHAAWEELVREAFAMGGELTPARRSRLLRESARAAFRAGDRGEHVDLLERSVELATSGGDRRYAMTLKLNLANALLEVGDSRRAVALALDVTREAAFGLDSFVSGATVHLARAKNQLGAFDEAREHALEGVRRFEKAGDRRVEGGARDLLAEALWGLGHPTLAFEEATRAVELLSVAPPLRPRARATLARVLLAFGRAEEAREAASVAASEAEALGAVVECPALVALVHAEAMLANGEDARAREALGAARDRLLTEAGKIKSLAHRRSFLENVTENARTLRLASALGPEREAGRRS